MSEAVWTMHEISSWYGSAAAIVCNRFDSMQTITAAAALQQYC
jgi:hypothetical protein